MEIKDNRSVEQKVAAEVMNHFWNMMIQTDADPYKTMGKIAYAMKKARKAWCEAPQDEDDADDE